MSIIKVVNKSDIEKEKQYFNEYITHDCKYLYLSYSSLAINGSSLISYNEYLDKLHVKFNIYELTEKIFLCTDFIHELPSNIKCFTNLNEIAVDGTRFWHLNCSQLPISITTIRLTKCPNLSSDCIIGMDRLTNLVALHLNDGMFDFYGEYSDQDSKGLSLPNLPMLKSINIYVNETMELYFASDWKDKVMNHQLLSNVKNRIVNVEFEEYYCSVENYCSIEDYCSVIIITIKN